MDRSGQTLGKYKLIRRLGKGGMAEVYLAIQPTIERQVAIKVLHGHLGDEQDFILRFKREARNLGQLQHPYIMRVIDFDFDKEENVYYMVMDYIAGPTLRSYLDEKGALPIEEALTIVAQLVEGLAYAHNKGAVHRDIKPANVMFSDASCQKAIITDFGITRMINDQTLTMEGSMVGTPAYMSPEAVLGERVDGRTDIYSIGVMLYEMVTGRTPYEGNTPLSMVVKQVHEPLPSPLAYRPDLPLPLVELIEKALSKEINGRFQTATEFLHAVQRIQNEMTAPNDSPTLAGATLPSEAKPTDTETVVKKLKNEASAELDSATLPSTPAWLPIVGAGVLLLALIVGALFFVGRGGNEATAPTATSNIIVAAPTGTRAPNATETAVVVTLVQETAASQPIDQTSTPDSPPAETAVATPSTTLPQVDPNRTGIVAIRPLGADTTAYQLRVDRVPLPDAGTVYTLWFGDANGFTRVDSDGFGFDKLRTAGTLEQNFFDAFDRVLVTLEANPDATTPSERVVFSGEYSEALLPLLQQLFVTDSGQFDEAAGQFAIANQHFSLAQAALEDSDLDEAKQHIEHMVNVLDGESGDAFGDLNLDGQIQNPGNGIGVRVYNTQIGETLAAIHAAEPQTVARQSAADLAIAAVNETGETIQAALQRGSAFAATDTVAEADPIAAELGTLFAEIVRSSTLVRTYAYQLAKLPVALVDGSLPPADPVADETTGRIGTLRLFNSEQRASTYFVAFQRLVPVTQGLVYRVYLRDSRSGLVSLLDEIEPFIGEIELSGDIEANVLRTFDQIVITLEEREAATDDLSGEIVAGGQIIDETAETVVRLRLENGNGEIGAFLGAEAQLRLAIQHHGFAQEALDAGDLGTAKIHVEHVVNILDGSPGSFFGDLNGDGQAQNPGDGVGVRGYWEQAGQTFDDLAQRDALTGNQRFALDRLSRMVSHNQAALLVALEEASRLLATDTIDEAQPFAERVTLQLDTLLNGSDLDGNGVIDPLRAEGGILAAADTLITLIDVALTPLEN